MPEFRVFRFDQNGRIRESEALVCATEQDAVEAARAFAKETEVELWQGTRFIGRVSGEGGLKPPLIPTASAAQR